MPRSAIPVCFSLGMGMFGVLACLLPWSLALEENLGLHLLFQLRGPRRVSPEVVIVAIDRPSARVLNLPLEPDKWPRTLHAGLVARMSDAGTAVIAFDVIFNESQSKQNDQAFARALRRAGNVVLAQSLTREKLAVTDKYGVPRASLNIERVLSPVAELADASVGQAPFPLPKVPVKLSRYWLFKPEAGDIPTLPVVAFQTYAMQAYGLLRQRVRAIDPDLAAALPALEAGSGPTRNVAGVIEALRRTFHNKAGLSRQMLADLERAPPPGLAPRTLGLLKAMLHLYSGGNSRYLNFYGPAGTIPTLSYHQVLGVPRESVSQSKIPDLEGKIVFVGQTETTWPKAHDGFYSVYTESGEDISGVEVVATAFANLLESRTIDPIGQPAHLGLVFGWGVAAALISLALPATVSAAGLLVLGGAYLFHALHQFQSAGLWYPIVIPLFLLLPVSFISALAWKYRQVSIERRNIRKAFGYYLPDAVVDQLTQNVKHVYTVGKPVYSICLITDAERYTTLSESMDPQDLTRLMNQYYEAIFAPVKAAGGVIVQVVGDSVLSLWTAPQPDDAQTIRACRAALAIEAAVARFNAANPNHALPTRIGVHAGYISLGHIGAMDHFEYRPVGDIVNTASRLEGLNKYLGTRILISHEVITQLQGFVSRCVGQFVFVGKSAPTKVHELLALGENGQAHYDELCRLFHSGVTAFRQRAWDAACTAFNQVLVLERNDGPSRFYIDQCHQFRNTTLAVDWDGTIHLKQK